MRFLAILLTCLWTCHAAAEPALETGPDQAIDGRRYRLLTSRPETSGNADIAILELRETGAGVAAINAELRAERPSTLARAAACHADSMAGPAQEAGEFDQSMQPTWWTDRLLAVSVYVHSSCGGPHPNFDADYRLWETTTGRRIGIATWFTAAALQKSTDREVRPSRPLRAIVLKHAGRRADPDCGDALRDNDYYLIQPGRAGMVFVPSLPHVVQACADDVVVPYAALGAFLGATARQELAIALPAIPPAAPAR